MCSYDDGGLEEEDRWVASTKLVEAVALVRDMKAGLVGPMKGRVAVLPPAAALVVKATAAYRNPNPSAEVPAQAWLTVAA
jgi:hypothetical protein